jgi:hypothetical protein
MQKVLYHSAHIKHKTYFAGELMMKRKSLPTLTAGCPRKAAAHEVDANVSGGCQVRDTNLFQLCFL